MKKCLPATKSKYFRFLFNSFVSGPLSLLCGVRDGSVGHPFGFCAIFAQVADLFDFFVCKMLNSHEGITRSASPNELVQFHLNRSTVPILRILDQENHEERNDGGPGIDD